MSGIKRLGVCVAAGAALLLGGALAQANVEKLVASLGDLPDFPIEHIPQEQESRKPALIVYENGAASTSHSGFCPGTRSAVPDCPDDDISLIDDDNWFMMVSGYLTSADGSQRLNSGQCGRYEDWYLYGLDSSIEVDDNCLPIDQINIEVGGGG